MNLDFVRSFVVFAEHLNLTHAAVALHISQPSLHTQIKRLTEDIGTPLYVRVARKLVLTAAGEQLARFGRELLDREAMLLSEIRGERSASPLRISAGNGAFRYLLGAALRRYRRLGLEVACRARSAPDALADLGSGVAHIAVFAGEEPKDFEAHIVSDVAQVALLPKTHRLAKRRSLKARELLGETLILGPPGSPHRQAVVQAIGSSQLSVAVEAGGWDLMAHFARIGLGVAIVNDFVELPRELVGIPIKDIASIRYWIAWPAGLRHRGVQRFVDLLR